MGAKPLMKMGSPSEKVYQRIVIPSYDRKGIKRETNVLVPKDKWDDPSYILREFFDKMKEEDL
jgi:deoxyhypusine synthase